MGKAHTAEVAVVGGGPSGLVAALALASSGAGTVLFAPPPPGADRRTTALLDGSLRVLETLGVWGSLAQHAAPLRRLRIVDATRRLIRAPEVTFDCGELGLEAFGYNIENEILRGALRAAAGTCAGLRIIEAGVDAVSPDADGVALRAGAHEERVALVAAADGRHSICRKAAGISMSRREFPQVALALNLRHARPHQDVSTEFHTESGPFTLVPLPGNRSSLVCVVTPDEADDLMARDDDDLSREIERRAYSILGRMEVDGARGRFPLSIELARTFASQRIALIGEAGHLLPPIGAQGLNLGIRDAATIAEFVADARHTGDDVGGAFVLDDFEARRRPDVQSRAIAVEAMNRSLLSDILPVHALRGVSLDLVSRVGFLRRALMQQGLGPGDETAPRLARGEAL
ncbi:MAG: UbiH/UbiF family hydroxylase [Bradyrhizobiaceae bacterium]|nr:UbiH/UbiF family hydroxylase [Bradyrhizobiaceae bacterium]